MQTPNIDRIAKEGAIFKNACVTNSLCAPSRAAWKVLPDQGEYYNPDFIGMKNDTVGVQGYVTDIISTLGFDWLNHRDTSKPFCLVIGEKATHRSRTTSGVTSFWNSDWPV